MRYALPKLLLNFCACFIFFFSQQSNGQIIWSNATGSQWLQPSSWTGGALPTATEIAQFGTNPTSATTGIGIQMDSIMGRLAIGALSVTSARTNQLIIGNSGTDSNGILQIAGATIDGQANTVISQKASNGAALTLQHQQGIGTRLMSIDLGSSDKFIQLGAGSSTTSGSVLNMAVPFQGTGMLAVLGNGTWNATSRTGVNGGVMRMGMPNTHTGGIIVGNVDGTQSAILTLDTPTALANVTGNNISIRDNSQLVLSAANNSSYNTSNVALLLTGHGNNATGTGIGALVNSTGNSYTVGMPIQLLSNTSFAVNGAGAYIRLENNITGAGQLNKYGDGNLWLKGTANAYTGGTQIWNGKLTVDTLSSISNGPLSFQQQGNVSTEIVFANVRQTISGLSSSFAATSGTYSHTITLNSGHVLTITQSGNTVFGAGTVPTMRSILAGNGQIIKNGTGRLTLSSGGHTLTGGIQLNAGEIRWSIPAATAVNLSSCNITLNGGSWSTVGIGANTSTPLTFGTITLQDNATLQLDNTQPHQLRFANSITSTWTTGKILTISQWRGSYNGTAGTMGRIFVGTSSSALTAAQLVQIRFVDTLGNNYRAILLSSGELVPALPTITFSGSFGPYCNTVSNAITVSFSTTGPFASLFKVQVSNELGIFPTDTSSNIIGVGRTSPINATLPSGYTAGTAYRIRVLNASPMVYGPNNGSNITLLGTPVLTPIVGNNSLVLSAFSQLTHAQAGGTWNSSNLTIASVSSTGLVDGIGLGTAIITYSYTNVCSLSSQITKSINVINSQRIIDVQPSNAKPGDTLTIRGQYFNTLSNSTLIHIGSSYVLPIVQTDTLLKAITPMNTLYGPVTVVDSQTQRITISRKFLLPFYNNTGLYADSIHLQPKIDLTTGTQPIGVQISDFNNDGKQDLLVVNGGPNTLYIYKNIGTSNKISAATFANPVAYNTGFGPYYARVADLDADGKSEIIIANASTTNNRISVLRNISTTDSIQFATKVDYAAGTSSPTDLAIGDIDGDNKPDICIVLQGTNKISILKNNCIKGIINSASFGTSVTFNTGALPFKMAIGDLDGDQKPEIAVSNTGGNTVSIFSNTASVGIINASSLASMSTYTVGNSPIGICIADINNDGKNDVLTANYSDNTISVLKNNWSIMGTLSFNTALNFAADRGVNDLSVMDIDGDTKLDVVTTCYDAGKIVIFKNTGTTSTFDATSLVSRRNVATGINPSGLALGDLDGDKIPDMAIANSGSNTLSVIENYPLPPNAPIFGIDSICVGSTTTLTNTVTGGIWVSKDTTLATVSASGIVTARRAGVDTIYYYTIAQGDTNASMKRITIDAYSPVGPITAARSTLCAGALLALTDSMPNGIWRSSNTALATVDSAGYVRGISNGVVTITYSISNSCASTMDTILLTVQPATGYTIGAITGAGHVCRGSNITVSDTSMGGSWTSNDTAIASINASGVVTGRSYGSVIITYGFTGSCGLYQDTAIIAVDTLLRIDTLTAPNSLCLGSYSLIVAPISTGGTWTLSNANIRLTADTISAITIGIDTLTYSYTNVCGTTTAQKYITVNPLADAGTISGGTFVCVGDTITLSSTAAGGTWRRTNIKAAITSIGEVIGQSAGIDTIYYTANSTCGTDTARHIVTIGNTNAGVITGPSSVCIGASITLIDTLAGGTWMAKNGAVSITSGGVVTGNTLGADTVWYIATNICGTDTASKKIIINPYPVLDTLTGPSLVCVGNSITLTTTDTAGVWGKKGTKITVSSLGVVRGVTAGQDTATYTKTVLGCATSAMKTITVQAVSAGTITTNATLCNASVTPLRSTVAGGIWSTTGNVTAIVTDSMLSATAVGSDTITYTVTGSCGTISTTKRITINPLPFADSIQGLNTVFIGDTLQLTNATSGGRWAMLRKNALINATGVVGGLKEGADTALYIVTNGCGSDTSYLPITIRSKSSETITGIDLYPNPSNGSFKIHVHSTLNETVSLVIADATFKLLSVQTIATNTDNQVSMTVASGLYYISIVNKNGWKNLRIVVNHE